jgi:phosphoribosylanthranilate isomerase
MVTRTFVKFCGFVRPVDVDMACALGVQAVGFVFYPASPRYIEPDDAAALRRRLPSWIQAVGLFVNAPTEQVLRVQSQCGLDVIQFHGDESQADCVAARGSSRSWWRAVRMKAATDLPKTIQSHPQAECLVLDAFSTGFGGSGKTFNWDWIKQELDVDHQRRQGLIVSGGLDAENVTSVLLHQSVFGVDVSSGIQSANPREKDAGKMEAFMGQVLEFDSERVRAMKLKYEAELKKQ